MNKYIFKKIGIFFLTLIFCLILGLIYLFSYNFAEPKAYDIMTKFVAVNKLPFDKNKKIYGSDDVVLVVIDDKSAEKYRWPWKRELYCSLFGYLSEYAKPKIIVHDSILSNLDKDNPESDKKYFNTIKKLNNLVTGFMPSSTEWDNQEFGKKYDEEFQKKYSVQVNDTDNSNINIFKSLLPFPKAYFDSIKHAGSVLMISGPISGNIFFRDEIIRNQIPFIKYKGAYYPSLAMKTFLILNDISEINLNKNTVNFDNNNYIFNIKRAFYQDIIPIRFYKLKDDYSHKKYSAVDLMDSYNQIKNGKKPILSPDLFKDKIVVIGANVTAGAGLNDNKNSSVRENHPGVDFQATYIDNLIHNEFLYVIPQIINFLITLIGILLIYFAINKFNLIKSIISILSVLAGYILLCIVCFYFFVVINVITPLVMFVLTTIFAYTHKYVMENRNKEKVKSAMGKYMSDDVMKNVIKNIDNLGLGGKKATVTVLFADIRGFTSMSEKMSAQQVSEILNEYFSEMEPIITSYNGIINKFIGDAIMAIFGEPIQDENHAQNAVKCAYAMLNKVEKLHKKWARENKPEIEIGIGINTGEVFIGNIGSQNRMEYTVIGDTVNLASRLESYNKMYKTKILISTSTYKEVKKIADVIKIPEVQIRGKANKIDIYEVLKVIIQ